MWLFLPKKCLGEINKQLTKKKVRVQSFKIMIAWSRLSVLRSNSTGTG